jgi:Icc-related predicted phosphoesterase
MRILLAADLHYALPQLDWIVRAAADRDVVVLAGDLVDIVSPVTVDAQIVALRASLADLASRTQLVVCSGNHDLNARSVAGEKTADWLAPLRAAGVAVDGDTIEVSGARFTVLGWWDGPVARAQAEAQLAEAGADAHAAGRAWIWVYHSPPLGPLAWTGSRHFGDPVVAEWIDRWRPTAVLMGHIHQAPYTPEGSWVDRQGTTWLFNAGKQIGPVPAHVELDLTEGWARWHSYEGVVEQALTDGPLAPAATAPGPDAGQ